MGGLDRELAESALRCASLTHGPVWFVAGFGLTWGEEVLERSRLAAVDA
jgi:hypothetical protein